MFCALTYNEGEMAMRTIRVTTAAVLTLAACTNTDALEARIAKLEDRVATLEGQKASAEHANREAFADLTRESAALDKQIKAAMDDVVAAQNDTDRAAASFTLSKLNQRKQEIETRLSVERLRRQVEGGE